MIIHSAEYYHALKNEMMGLKSIIDSKPYCSDTVFLNEGIKKEIAICEIALGAIRCSACIHHLRTENRCAVLGNFPPDLNRDTYSCVNWVFDDLPF